MATRPASPPPTAASRPRLSTSGLSSTRTKAATTARSRFSPLQGSGFPRSDDLAGRAVALSQDIPALFDAPLATHHRLIGRWILTIDPSSQKLTRREARAHIERRFSQAVLDILNPVQLADLQVVVLDAQDERPPTAAITCESLGQLDLGWIETSDAPIPWRAAAYKALEKTLGTVLPVFGYHDLFEWMSMCYWEGEATDEAARQYQIEMHGVDPEEIDEEMLPSAMDRRRPEWMIEANSGRPKTLPASLRQALHKLNTAHKAVRRLPHDHNAWRFDSHDLYEYVPGAEDSSCVPPLTLVPFEQFAHELDDMTQQGMDCGFMDIAGLCPLPDAGMIGNWLASLRAGTDFLVAAQELIQLDSTKM